VLASPEAIGAASRGASVRRGIEATVVPDLLRDLGSEPHNKFDIAHSQGVEDDFEVRRLRRDTRETPYCGKPLNSARYSPQHVKSLARAVSELTTIRISPGAKTSLTIHCPYWSTGRCRTSRCRERSSLSRVHDI
jgi:hypothetical protein